MTTHEIDELRSQLQQFQDRLQILEDRDKESFAIGGRRTQLKSNSKSKSKTKSKTKTKKKVNAYFQAMIKAKKNNMPSFTYGGKTYVGSKHPQLGMVYKSK